MDTEKTVLIEKYIEESLSESESIELLSLIREDSGFRKEFVSALRFHGLIESASYDDSGYEKLSEIVMKAVGPVQTGGSFETRVMRKISKRLKTTRNRNQRSAAMFRQIGLSLAASILIIAGVFYINSEQNRAAADLIRARLIKPGSDTQVIRNSSVITAEEGMDLQIGDRVKTGFERDVRIRYKKEQTELGLKKGTILSLAEEDAGKRVDLEIGNLTADISAQPAGNPFQIGSNEAVADIIADSSLSLDAEPGWTSLEVTEGEVGFTRKEDNRRIVVKKDHYAIAGMGVEFAPIPILTSEPETADIDLPGTQTVKPGPKTVKPRTESMIPKVLSFTLINADTDEPVEGYDPIPEGAVIDMNKLGLIHINIRANTEPPVCGNVRFDLNGKERVTLECIAPYALKGDTDGDYNEWNFKPGKQTVTAVPFAGRVRKGTKIEQGRQGEAKTITFTIR